MLVTLFRGPARGQKHHAAHGAFTSATPKIIIEHTLAQLSDKNGVWFLFTALTILAKQDSRGRRR